MPGTSASQPDRENPDDIIRQIGKITKIETLWADARQL
jgi:hypothetical protein